MLFLAQARVLQLILNNYSRNVPEACLPRSCTALVNPIAVYADLQTGIWRQEMAYAAGPQHQCMTSARAEAPKRHPHDKPSKLRGVATEVTLLGILRMCAAQQTALGK